MKEGRKEKELLLSVRSRKNPLEASDIHPQILFDMRKSRTY